MVKVVERIGIEMLQKNFRGETSTILIICSQRDRGGKKKKRLVFSNFRIFDE